MQFYLRCSLGASEYTTTADESCFNLILNVPNYAPFTAANRRYADLVVQRLLGCVLQGAKIDNLYSPADLEKLCAHLNYCKLNYQLAEKQADIVLFYWSLRDTPILSSIVVTAIQKTKISVFIPEIDERRNINLENHFDTELISFRELKIRKKLEKKGKKNTRANDKRRKLNDNSDPYKDLIQFQMVNIKMEGSKNYPVEVLTELLIDGLPN